MNPNFQKIYDRVKKQADILGLNISDNDLKRKAWVIGNRDVFEKSTSLSNSSSSSAAGAGAGAGGRRLVQISNFSGYYDVDNWNLIDPDDSSVDTSGSPESIILNGVDEGTENSYLDYTIESPTSGKVSFTWRYITQDGGTHSVPLGDGKVDIGSFIVGSNIEIRVRPRSNFEDVFSSLTFTIRWQSDKIVTLGEITQTEDPQSYIPISTQGDPMSNGQYKYQIYTGVGNSTLQSVGASWSAGQEYVIATIPVSGDVSGIFNDSWTNINNGNYFVSLSGEDKTGIIYTLPAPSYDRFIFILNDDLIQLSNDLGGNDQVGIYETPIGDGDLFGFRIDPTDSQSGRASVTITSFSAPVVIVEDITVPDLNSPPPE